MSQSGSDHDLEKVDIANDFVMFHDVQDVYRPNEDIFVVYQLGDTVVPSSRDWVGLYQEKWNDPGDYITFQWAPKTPKDQLSPFLRSVLFQAKYFKEQESDVSKFQLLYVSKHSHVLGVSKLFKICNYRSPTFEDISFVSRSLSLEGIDSLTLIDMVSKDSQQDELEMSNRFELLDFWAVAAATEEKKPLKRLYDPSSLLNASITDDAKRSRVDLQMTRRKRGRRERFVPWLKRIDFGVFRESSKYEVFPVGGGQAVVEKEAIIPYNQNRQVVPYVPLFNVNWAKDWEKEFCVAEPIPVGSQAFIGPLPRPQDLHVEDDGLVHLHLQQGFCLALRQAMVSPPHRRPALLAPPPAGTCLDCARRGKERDGQQRELQASEFRCELLRAEVANQANINTTKDMLIDNLAEKLQQLQDENGALTAANYRLCAVQSTLRRAAEQSDRLRADNSNLATQVEKLSDETGILAHQNKLMSCLLEARSRQLDGLKQKLVRVEKQQQLLKKQHSEMVSSHSQLDATLREREEEKLELERKLEEADTAVRETREKEESLSAIVVRERKEHADMCRRMQERTSTLQQRIQYLQQILMKRFSTKKNIGSQTEAPPASSRPSQTEAPPASSCMSQTEAAPATNSRPSQTEAPPASSRRSQTEAPPVGSGVPASLVTQLWRYATLSPPSRTTATTTAAAAAVKTDRPARQQQQECVVVTHQPGLGTKEERKEKEGEELTPPVRAFFDKATCGGATSLPAVAAIVNEFRRAQLCDPPSQNAAKDISQNAVQDASQNAARDVFQNAAQEASARNVKKELRRRYEDKTPTPTTSDVTPATSDMTPMTSDATPMTSGATPTTPVTSGVTPATPVTSARSEVDVESLPWATQVEMAEREKDATSTTLQPDNDDLVTPATASRPNNDLVTPATTPLPDDNDDDAGMPAAAWTEDEEAAGAACRAMNGARRKTQRRPGYYRPCGPPLRAGGGGAAGRKGRRAQPQQPPSSGKSCPTCRMTFPKGTEKEVIRRHVAQHAARY